MSTAYDIPCVEHKIDVLSIKVVSAHERGRATVVAMCSCEDPNCAWTTSIESTSWISSQWPTIREVTPVPMPPTRTIMDSPDLEPSLKMGGPR